MDDTESIFQQFFSLLRRRFLSILLVTVGAFSLVPLSFLAMWWVIFSQPGARAMSPMMLWEASSGSVRFAAIIIFIVAAFLPRDLTEAGVAIIAWTDRGGGPLTLRTFLAPFARALPRLIPVSLCFGFLNVAGARALLGVFLAFLFALVMPVLGTTRLRPWPAVRTGLRLTMRQFGAVLMLCVSTWALVLPPILGLWVALRIASEGPDFTIVLRTAVVLVVVYVAILTMFRSVFLALIYIKAAYNATSPSEVLPAPGTIPGAKAIG